MRNILAIARKELNVYFTTPIAYVVLCIMTFIASYLFLNDLQHFVQLSGIAMTMPERVDPAMLNLTDVVMVPLMVAQGFVILLAVPFLSMRLLAEEKSGRTFELLMTTPVRPTEIVLGKYLGGVSVLGLLVLLFFSYPLVLNHYGASAGAGGDALEWSTTLAGYGGLLLFAAAAMAVGLFISSVTDSQVVAAFITFAVMLLAWLLTMAGSAVESPGLKELLFELAPGQHLLAFIRGEVAVKDLLYFASVILLGLFLTQRAVESQRWS